MFNRFQIAVIAVLLAVNIFLLVLISQAASGELKVRFFDVGQGDAIFLV